jgi:hypothetical protein
LILSGNVEVVSPSIGINLSTGTVIPIGRDCVTFKVSLSVISCPSLFSITVLGVNKFTGIFQSDEG